MSLPDFQEIGQGPGLRRLLEAPIILLRRIQRTLMLRLRAIAHEDTVGHNICSVVSFSAPFAASKISHFRYPLPLRVRHGGEPALEVSELLLQLGHSARAFASYTRSQASILSTES